MSASDGELDGSHLQLGSITGVHGVRGAVRVKLFNPDSSALAPGVEVVLQAEGRRRTFEIARIAQQAGNDMLRLWLVGVESREAAEALRGHELWIDRSTLPALDDDEYYLADLIGLTVEREVDGQRESLGKITGVITNTAQALLSVRWRGREWLLPAMPPFIVALEDACVLVDVHDELLPEGAQPERRGRGSA